MLGYAVLSSVVAGATVLATSSTVRVVGRGGVSPHMNFANDVGIPCEGECHKDRHAPGSVQNF
eukprot:2666026-Prymnesium_polylepis.1